MKTWSEWLPDILPHVPGCPNIVAEHELRRAARIFFIQTRAWQVFLPTVPVAIGQSAIDLTPADTGQELVRVEQVYYDGKVLDEETPERLSSIFYEDWSTKTGTPLAYVQLTPNIVRTYPLPIVAATTGVRARVAITPSQTATGVQNDLALRYWEDLRTGALSRLLIFPSVPWANIPLAANYVAMFQGTIDSVNIQVARSFGNARIPSRPRFM